MLIPPPSLRQALGRFVVVVVGVPLGFVVLVLVLWWMAG